MKESIQSAIYIVSCLLLLAGAVGLMVVQVPWTAWLMLVGGLGYSIAHMARASKRRDASLREKRLSRLASIAGFLWLVAAVASLNHLELWAPLTLATVIFMAYSDISLVSLRRKKKEEAPKEGNRKL